MTAKAPGAYVKLPPSTPVLTREEERELADRLPDPAARDRLVTSNIKIVGLAVRNSRVPRRFWPDLASYLLCELVKCADPGRFDPAKGFRFSTYAGNCLRQLAKKYCLQHEQMIHTPLYLFDPALAGRIRTPGGRRRAAERGEAAGVAGRTLTTDRLGILEGHGPAAAEAEAPFEAPPGLAPALAALDGRERAVIREAFGLGCEPRSGEAIAADMGVTRQRVDQLRRDALRKLRDALSPPPPPPQPVFVEIPRPTLHRQRSY